MLFGQFVEASTQILTAGCRLGQSAFFLHGPDRAHTARAGNRMPGVCEPARERIILQPSSQLFADTHGAQRDVAAVDALRAGQNIRLNTPMIDGEPFTGSAKPSHHLVCNKKDAVFFTGFRDTFQVTRRWHNDPVSPCDWFQNDRGNGFRIFIHQDFLQMRAALADRTMRSIGMTHWATIAIGIHHANNARHVTTC